MIFQVKTPDDTIIVAKKIASLLQNNDVVLLEGNLGVGKTFFAREVIKTLCPKVQEVQSPTFNLVQIYENDLPKKVKIWHFDLYRLEDSQEIWEIGLEEAMADGISLIEWAEKIKEFLPKEYLKIIIDWVFQNTNARKIEIIPVGEKWIHRLAKINFDI